MNNPVTRAWVVLRTRGPAAMLARVFEHLSGEKNGKPSAVRYEDARSVDWSVPHPAVTNPITVTRQSMKIAWIMSPPQESSGGHQTIFRFIRYLEDAGHEVKIYFYSVDAAISIPQVRNMVSASLSYPNVRASMEWYPEGGVPHGVDAIFATGWETAYPSFLDRSPARRFYFVQDFEPYFYPVGSDSVLADNTYRFGFTGITAGGWLADRLRREYGMTTSHFDFGADRAIYKYENSERRSEVFFYARPGTTRRGFELGLMTLDNFSRARPDYTINLAGWNVKGWDIPFAYQNHKSVSMSRLNEIYNKSAVGLVMSLTNMSLMPLELLAAGAIPVVNEGANNRMVSDNPFIEFAPSSPVALANRMVEIVDRPDLPEHARAGASSLVDADWDMSGATFVADFERYMRG